MKVSTLNNEKKVLLLAAQGDEVAFTQLFYAYHNKLGAYIYRLTESYEVAEEIVVDVFVKIWTNREALATIEHFESYIYVLSRNHTLNYLRHLAVERAKKREIAEYMQEEPYTMDSWEEPVTDYYELLDQAVEKLPPQQQKVYIFSKRKRLKYDEIALQMHISRETVKKYLKLATHSIIRYVRTHGDTLMILLFIILTA